MQNITRIAFERPVRNTPELDRATAKLQYHAERIFGHDHATLAPEDGVEVSRGNPRFNILKPLALSVLYRLGHVDPRNKRTKASFAEDALRASKDFEESMVDLKNKYDGLDFSSMRIWFDTVVPAVKPGYEQGVSQLALIPSLEQEETSFLLEEMQVCSAALLKVAPKFTGTESPLVPTLPFIRFNADVTTDEKALFVKTMHEKMLPIGIELGDLAIESNGKGTFTF